MAVDTRECADETWKLFFALYVLAEGKRSLYGRWLAFWRYHDTAPVLVPVESPAPATSIHERREDTR